MAVEELQQQNGIWACHSSSLSGVLGAVPTKQNMNRLLLLHGFTRKIVQYHNHRKLLLSPHYGRDVHLPTAGKGHAGFFFPYKGLSILHSWSCADWFTYSLAGGRAVSVRGVQGHGVGYAFSALNFGKLVCLYE